MGYNEFYAAWYGFRDQLTVEGQAHFDNRYHARAYVPMHIFVFSLWLGGLGIDRFLLGQWGLGLAKLLTLGGLGIWTIVDWFLIASATRRRNHAIASDIIADMHRLEDESDDIAPEQEAIDE